VGVISENKVREYIVPFLSVGKRGFKSRLNLTKVMLLILKRVKTGCQWRELVIKEYFDEEEVCWQTIYYYFNKWSRDGSFKEVWINLLQANKQLLDLSTAQLDGSHTPSKRGGESVGYQGRKSCKTSNILILSDNNGMPICIGEPQSGNQNDLFDIDKIFGQMVEMLGASEVSLKGVFLNADPGFDSNGFKKML
jgi:transposase